MEYDLPNGWGFSRTGKESNRQVVSRLTGQSGLRKTVLAEFDQLVRHGMTKSDAAFHVLYRWGMLEYFPPDSAPVVKCLACGFLFCDDGSIESRKHAEFHNSRTTAAFDIRLRHKRGE